MLAVLAAFFCLLFFAAAKKSRCRPAQGRRLKHEGITRMPAQRQTHRTGSAAENESQNQTKNRRRHSSPIAASRFLCFTFRHKQQKQSKKAPQPYRTLQQAGG